jgi:exopolyphosphatase/guanosine-5'-triphosphate,3'-diphosphate pyrophosphatase
MLNKKNMAGLAGYVDKDGILSDDGIKKAVHVLKSFRQILENINVAETFVFATASLRNIANTQAALDAIQKRTGFEIDLVSGQQKPYTILSEQRTLRTWRTEFSRMSEAAAQNSFFIRTEKSRRRCRCRSAR